MVCGHVIIIKYMGHGMELAWIAWDATRLLALGWNGKPQRLYGKLPKLYGKPKMLYGKPQGLSHEIKWFLHTFTAAATLAWQQHVFWTPLIVWSSLASCCWQCTLACLWHQGLAHMAANVNCWEQMCLVHNMGSQKALAKDMVVEKISITNIAINFVYITI